MSLSEAVLKVVLREVLAPGRDGLQGAKRSQ